MDKAALFAPHATTKTKEVPVEGGVVLVRGLSRFELMHAQEMPHNTAGTRAAQERYILSKAMIDPVLNEDELKEWQSLPGAVADINDTCAAINTLSGVGKAAAKSDVPADGDRSDG